MEEDIEECQMSRSECDILLVLMFGSTDNTEDVSMYFLQLLESKDVRSRRIKEENRSV